MNSDNISIRTTDHPTDVGSVHFGMFFNCSLIHPTVVFRRRVLTDFQYNSDNNVNESTTSSSSVDIEKNRRRIHHVEDYSLWLRVVCSNRFKIANVAVPLLRLRKHSSNISSVHAIAQRASASALRASALRIVLPTMSIESSNRIAQLMATPDSLTSFDDANALVSLIDTIVQFLNVRT